MANILTSPGFLGATAIGASVLAVVILRRNAVDNSGGGWLLNSDVQHFLTTNQVFTDIDLVNRTSSSTSLAVRITSSLNGTVAEVQDFLLGPYPPNVPQQLAVVFDWPGALLVFPGDVITVQWQVFLPTNLNNAVAQRVHSLTVT